MIIAVFDKIIELAIWILGIRINYYRYIRSSRWRRKAEKIKRRDNWTCASCQNNSRRYLQVHHLTYVRLGRERSSDLVTLCVSCHSALRK